MYKICVLVDKFYKFGGGEIFLEDLINNSSEKLDFRYLISLEKPKNTYQNPLHLPLKVLDFNEENIKTICSDCDVLLFWGRVLDHVKYFSIKKVMWAHSDFNVNFFLEKAEEHTDHFIACSTNVKNAIKKKNCTVIFPGLDTSRYKNYSNFEVKKMLGFEEKDFVIGLFCRFEKFKNIPFLIKSISSIKDLGVKVLLIGHGDELSNVIKLCEEKIPKRFQYVYYSETERISFYYNCLDAFCLPSNGEGYARVQWESAFFKVPFIGTNVGGVEDGIIHGHNGFVISEEKDLEAIVQKLKNQEYKKTIIKNAYDFFVKEGQIENTVLKVEKLFEKLIDNRKKLYV